MNGAARAPAGGGAPAVPVATGDTVRGTAGRAGHGDGVAFGLAANLLLRVAAAAAGVALTLRLASMPEVVGPALVGFLGGLDSAVELLVAVPAGRLSDRWGRRPLLLGGAAAATAGLLLAGLGTTPALLVLGRAVQGFGTGLTVPPLLGWFADAAAAREPGRRGRVMAGVEAGTAAGLLAGAVLGSVVWSAARTTGFLLLALLFAGATALFAAAPNMAQVARSGAGGAGVAPSAGATVWRDLRLVLAAPGLARLLLAWVLLNAVVGLWLTHAVYQLNLPQPDPQQFLVGVGQTELRLESLRTEALPVILAAWALLFIGGALAWGPLLERVGPWPAMRHALMGMLLVCGALAILNAGGAPPLLRWAVLPLFGAGVLLEAGFAPAALTQLAADAGAARRGMTMGLYSVAFGLGSVLGSWAGGPFAERWAMNGVIAATAILAGTALAVLSAEQGGPDRERRSMAGREPT